MTNRFPGNCFVCSRRVEAGAGAFQRKTGALKRKLGSGWVVRCRKCVGAGNKPQEKIIRTVSE